MGTVVTRPSSFSHCRPFSLVCVYSAPQMGPWWPWRELCRPTPPFYRPLDATLPRRGAVVWEIWTGSPRIIGVKCYLANLNQIEAELLEPWLLAKRIVLNFIWDVCVFVVSRKLDKGFTLTQNLGVKKNNPLEKVANGWVNEMSMLIFNLI